MNKEQIETEITRLESELYDRYMEYDPRVDFWIFQERLIKIRQLYSERNAPYPKRSKLYGDSDQARVERIDEIFQEITEEQLKYYRENGYNMEIFEERLKDWWKKGGRK
jgi:hypothetical protein